MTAFVVDSVDNAITPPLTEAVRCLRQGGVIAYPTEGVFGLGCDPWQANSVHTLLELKQRSPEQGLILIAATVDQVLPWVAPNLSAACWATVTATWPGPMTWLLPPSSKVPAWITGIHDRVALRVTAHTQAAALCQHFGGAIVSTSANPHGQPAATSASAAKAYFSTRLACVLPGDVDPSLGASEIRDALTGEVIRPRQAR